MNFCFDPLPYIFWSNLLLSTVIVPWHHSPTCRSDLNISEFNKKMKSLDWQPVMSCFDTQTAYSMFHNIYYVGYYDQYFPIHKVNSVYKNRKKWLSLGLKNLFEQKINFTLNHASNRHLTT